MATSKNSTQTEQKALQRLRSEWSKRSQLFRAHGITAQADLIDLLANELQQALASIEAEVLSLKEAAAESGYSADHLRRLIREKKISNAGRKYAPLIERKQLPSKRAQLRNPEAGLMFDRSRLRIARAVVGREEAHDD